MNEKLQSIFNGIVEGQVADVTSAVVTALEFGIDPAVFLDDGMIAAMAEVGHRFEKGDYYVPEMMIAAQATQVGLSQLKP
jgi:5-methyltetrahydrofolate--homocysteine methyltransferase